MQKTLVVSHIADLDGVASAVLAAHYLYDRDGVKPEVIFADYEDAFSKVADAAKDKEEIWICDLSWKPVSMSLIEKLDHAFPDRILFFDHHKSSQACFDAWNDKATIHFDCSGTKCTADLIWDHIQGSYFGKTKQNLEKIVSAAHSRDLWIRNDPNGCYISDVIDVFGAYSVFEKLFSDLTLIEKDNFPLAWVGACKQAEKAREESYDLAIRSKVTTSFQRFDKTVYVSACLSNGFVSEVGDRILREMEGGMIGFIDVKSGTLSFRADHESVAAMGIGVNDIAAILHPNGGGHPVAAGAAMSHDFLKKGTYFLLGNMQSAILSLMPS